MNTALHETIMSEALKEAKLAYDKGEVPIGAIVVSGDKIISRSHNLIETLKDATAHAEILAIKDASKEIQNWRLNSFSLYVTLEPCIMCMGAIQNSRIDSVFFGAFDKVAGACKSVIDLTYDHRGKREIKVEGGILHDQCLELLQCFFQDRRKSTK